MSDKKYTKDDIQRLGGVIAENIISEFRAGFEAIKNIKESVARIPQMQEDINELKQDMRIIKAAVTDTNRELHALDKRVAQLEAAA